MLIWTQRIGIPQAKGRTFRFPCSFRIASKLTAFGRSLNISQILSYIETLTYKWKVWSFLKKYTPFLILNWMGFWHFVRFMQEVHLPRGMLIATLPAGLQSAHHKADDAIIWLPYGPTIVIQKSSEGFLKPHPNKDKKKCALFSNCSCPYIRFPAMAFNF